MSFDDETLNRLSKEAGDLADAWREHWRLHYEGHVRALEAILKVQDENLDAARGAIKLLRDESDPVIAAAERLVQDALGDDQLWAALGPLREALATCPSRLNPRTGELWRQPEPPAADAGEPQDDALALIEAIGDHDDGRAGEMAREFLVRRGIWSKPAADEGEPQTDAEYDERDGHA